MPSAALYKDEGVNDFTLNATLSMLQSYGVDCDCIGAADILNGALANCDLFVMPGGADEPYHAKLGDKGAALIRDFVTVQGGSFLGICAGAYYACDRFEFNKGLDSEICRERPLKFFEGIAQGSILEFAPPYDLSLSSAAVVPIILDYGVDEKMGAGDAQHAYVYYHGGPVFLGAGIAQDNTIPQGQENQDTVLKVIARYHDLPSHQNAAVLCKTYLGSGGRVVLSSPHFEVEADDFELRLKFENNPQDYSSLYNDLQVYTTGRDALREKILSFLLS